MTADFDPTIKDRPLSDQIDYWTKRVTDLEAKAPAGVRESKNYPLRQAQAELRRLLAVAA